MRSVARVQIPVSPPNKTDKCLLVRFCFSILNNRDLNESVKKTTRCVVFSGCPKAFAKHKNISHGLLCKRQEQIPVSPMDITDKCLLVRFCFTSLNNRDFARCGASCRLRREPRLVNLPASEEKKKANGFRLTKNGAQQGARRLDKKNYL